MIQPPPPTPERMRSQDIEVTQVKDIHYVDYTDVWSEVAEVRRSGIPSSFTCEECTKVQGLRYKRWRGGGGRVGVVGFVEGHPLGLVSADYAAC